MTPTPGAIEIDVHDTIGPLKYAPIVEAIIEFRGPVQSNWEEDSVKEKFEQRLKDTHYQYLDSFREYAQEITLSAKSPKASESKVQYLGWKGLRFKSEDGRHVVQFNRNGFVSSWLKPYETWEQFQEEAMQAWRIYRDIALTETVERIGVRFINRIPLGGDVAKVGDLLRSWPSPPADLPLRPVKFLHVDDFDVPGHSYHVRITATIQPEQMGSSNGPSLILDIDVSTTESPQSTDEALVTHLREMRWLKNKAFVGSVTETAMNRFRGDE